MTKQLRGTVCVVLSAVLFGIMPLLAVRVYAYGGNPVFASFCRFAFSLPLLCLLSRRQAAGRERFRADRRFLLICFGYVLTPSLLFASYLYIASSLATTAHFVYPALVLLICRVVFRQKIPILKYVCCVMCLLGVMMFCLTEQKIHYGGMILALASAWTYSVYVSYLPASGLQERFTPFQLTFRLNICGAAVMAVINTAMGTWVCSMPLAGWAFTLLLSWGTAVLAAVLFQLGVSLCGAQNAAMFSTMEPLTSVVMGILFLHEELTVQSALGVLLILSAVLTLSAMDRRRKPA